MSIGTIWNHRDFIERVYGKEDAIEFEQVVKKYQAEQIAIEQERIIKLLDGLMDFEADTQRRIDHKLALQVLKDALIKGEK